MQTIRQSPGGHKLSQEALEAIIILAADALLPHDEEKLGAEILMNAHEYLWAQDYPRKEIRLEACNLLFELSRKCAESAAEEIVSSQGEIAKLIEIKPRDRKKLN